MVAIGIDFPPPKVGEVRSWLAVVASSTMRRVQKGLTERLTMRRVQKGLMEGPLLDLVQGSEPHRAELLDHRPPPFSFSARDGAGVDEG